MTGQPDADIDAPIHVPNDETPATRCPYCGRPFRTESLGALHLGERHSERLSEDERTAYEEAVDAEGDELFVYHLKVTAALVLLFFAFAYAYTFVWMG
jgi:hypothetical protein